MKKLLIPILILLAAPIFARPLVIAHRASGGFGPENTIVGAKAAWKAGADIIEIDVRLTKDNKAVLLHNPNTIDYTGVDLNVADATFARLRAMDFGTDFDPKYKGARIPTLQEMLMTVPKGRYVFFDTKVFGEKVAEIIAANIKATRTEDRCLVQINDLDTLRAFHKLMPNVKLVGDVDRYGTVENSVELDKEFHYEYVNFHALYSPDRVELVKKMVAAGMKPLGWSIDSVVWARIFADAGMKAFMTNRAEVMLRAFDK